VTLHVELVSPERILYSGDAEMVICRTLGGGEIAFLSGHTPFLGALDIAPVRIKTTEGNWEEAAVDGGFVHVRDDNAILLSDAAELASQIDVEKERRRREELERRIMDTDDAECEAQLRGVHVRLELAGRVG
jgi:F-type H+-transporting ATPase subunit epsilon